jgi:prephenate dehydrogenase
VRPAAVVLGAAGGFGRAFAQLLVADGVPTLGIDLAEGHGDEGFSVLRADATGEDERVLAAVAGCRWLVVCLPDGVALVATGRMQPALPAGALIVDTLSVKSPVASFATQSRVDLEWLSLNPLFAPDLPFRSRHVAAVMLRPGPESRRFVALVQRAGATVTELSADEHDREAAVTQVLVHAAVLAVGRCLASLSPASEWRLVTPPFRLLTLLVGRVVGGDWEVYRHIQADNPHAAAARAALSGALSELDQATRSPELFADFVDGVHGGLGHRLPELRAAASTLLRDLPTAALPA